MIDKGIRYEDQKLTKKQKKKIKPANQGGGPNYLGKQKTVTVPKKWLSDPDHVVAELAYITPKEKKILIDLDLYGSLNGKPNRGPAGIQSLQGDMGGFGGTGGGGGGAPGPGDTGGEGGNSPQDNSTSQFGGGSPSTGGDSGDTREQYSVTRTTTPIDKEVEVPEIGPVERDTGLEKARQANIALANELSKYTPPPVNLPTLGPFSFLTNTLLQGPIDAFNKFTAEKNIDFFQENVAGKHGYGYGIEDYEQYMDDRMSGKVGAYGNENMGQNAINERGGGDNRQDISGILQALIQPVEEPVVLPKGFNYTPYSNQVVIAPGSQGLASLTGGQGFLQNII
jgi:hypothetical protein